jgi:hypothetical protein
MTARVPGAVNLSSAQLTPDMILPLAMTSPRNGQTTLGDLVGFIGSAASPRQTTISTVGDGVLTAAAIKGGVIVRNGSVAAFTDTTATAAAIIAALGSDAVVGSSFYLIVKNITAFTETLAAGAGVTLNGNKNVIPGNSVGFYLVTYTSATAVTIFGLFVGALSNNSAQVITTLSTVGAGTITAAGIAGQTTMRTGSVAAFTDTTDTADAIIAAIPNARIGVSFVWTYYNGTVATATLAGGVGVTVTGGTTIAGSGGFGRYLVTYTAASTVTVVFIGGASPSVSEAQFTTAALSVGTLAAGAITGAAFTVLQNTGATPAAQTTRTAAQMLADFVGASVGFTYILRIVNTGAGTLTLTGGGGTGVTVTGTATVAQNVFRDYLVTFNTNTTATIQSIGSGVSP